MLVQVVTKVLGALGRYALAMEGVLAVGGDARLTGDKRLLYIVIRV